MIAVVDASNRIVAVHEDADPIDYAAHYPGCVRRYMPGHPDVGGEAPTEIQDLRVCVKEDVRRNHDSALTAGMSSALGFRVDVLPANVADWMGTLLLVNMTGVETVTIRDADNIVRVLSVADYRQLCVEIGVFLTGLRATKWAKQAAADAATTPEELPSPDM